MKYQQTSFCTSHIQLSRIMPFGLFQFRKICQQLLILDI